MSSNKPRKKLPNRISFSLGFETIFLREASVHKMEQNDCSAGNQSQRRHALHTEEETILYKDTVDTNSTIYTF